MTAQEVAKILNKSVSTIETSFSRTQTNLKKQGIILTKTGYGKNKEYFISYSEDYIPPLDFIGKKFNKLTIIEQADSIYTGGKKRGAFKCICDCGNTTIVLKEKIIKGTVKSCGCLKKEMYENNQNNLTNQKFGKWLVLKEVENKRYSNGHRMWEC